MEMQERKRALESHLSNSLIIQQKTMNLMVFGHLFLIKLDFFHFFLHLLAIFSFDCENILNTLESV